MGTIRALVLFSLFLRAWAYIETVEAHGCESCALRLTCRHFDSIIAILAANFEALDTDDRNSTNFSALSPRMALNRRCSGVNYCSFILTKDCPGADQWGLGNLTVKYACVAAKRVTKFCNTEIVLPSPETIGVSQGFVHNPGYPRFYLGRQECRWRIQAPPLQRIKIVIFDVSLVGHPFQECADVLEISASGQTIYRTCKQEEPPVEVVSRGETLEVILQPAPTESVLPRRGVLFYYSAVGCSTPSAPKDGYLVYRNDTTAEFSCCVGFAFPDTRVRQKTIRCLGYRWDTEIPLPSCQNNTKLTENHSSKELVPKFAAMSDTVKEIVIPTLVIIALFLINSIVLFVIYKYRQRKDAECSEDELGTLPVAYNKETPS